MALRSWDYFDLDWGGVKRPCYIICNTIWIHSRIKEMFRNWRIFPRFLLLWFKLVGGPIG